MLSININKDVEQYQESVLAGFNASQFIAIVLGIGVFAGTFALLHYVVHIPMMVCIYVALVPAIPVVLIGFGSKNGMSFFERVKRTLNRKKVPLFYEATESAVAYRVLERSKRDEKEEKVEFENAKRHMQRGLLLMAILLVICAVAYFLLTRSGVI